MSEGPQDAVLVHAAQSGDVASLGALLGRHRARMLAVATNILGHGPQAEDAVQDACVIAVRRIGELRDPAAAGAWLVAIVTNACRAQLRRPALELLTELGEPPETPATTTIEQEIERCALRDWVWTALERLSEPLRLVVMLRYFSGVSSYDAIGELCGVPIGTVRSRLNAAKAKLAEELLGTVGQPHLHPGGAHSAAGAEVLDAMRRFGQDGDRRVLRDALSPDLAFVMFDRVERVGRDAFADVILSDMADGVSLRPIRMVTASDVTVFEAWLDSPPENPLHCPPALTQVYHHPRGPAERVVSYYAARPADASDAGGSHPPAPL